MSSVTQRGTNPDGSEWAEITLSSGFTIRGNVEGADNVFERANALEGTIGTKPTPPASITYYGQRAEQERAKAEAEETEPQELKLKAGQTSLSMVEGRAHLRTPIGMGATVQREKVEDGERITLTQEAPETAPKPQSRTLTTRNAQFAQVKPQWEAQKRKEGYIGGLLGQHQQKQEQYYFQKTRLQAKDKSPTTIQSMKAVGRGTQESFLLTAYAVTHPRKTYQGLK